MALAAVLGTVESDRPGVTATRLPRTSSNAQSTEDKVFTLVGAGDIAGCGAALAGAEATAKLIEKIPGEVFASGDFAYEHGNAAEFHDCYGKTWGRFKDRTHPSLGNHEYGTPEARDYFRYWGDRAGPVGKGYYSFDLGVWHIIALNSNCDAPGLGGCAARLARRDVAEARPQRASRFLHHRLRPPRAFQQRNFSQARRASRTQTNRAGFIRRAR